MQLLNLTLGQFLAVFGAVAGLTIALYLLDRSRRRQVVATLRFWTAADRPPAVARRRRIQQPLSLLLQLASVVLLLLAIAELRLGGQAGAPRDHVLILDTSAWMAAASGDRTLMEAAKDRARAYVAAVPQHDRIMLVRADALAQPATPFEPDRGKLARAIDASRPGATALNLDQALAFARRIQARDGRRAGEIAFAGAGRITDAEPASAPPDTRHLRALLVPDDVANCGLRKIGLRRSASDPALWEIYVAARNYTAVPRTVTVALTYGPPKGSRVAVGARRLSMAPGADQETAFEFRSREAGVLEATLLPHDDFPEDDRAVLEVPAQPLLAVTVYSGQPDLLRPVLAADARVSARFRAPGDYRPADGGDLMIVDRFRPPASPAEDSIWIDPPAAGSPVPVRLRVAGVPFGGWHAEVPLGAGLRTKDFKLEAASIFEAAPDDIRVGEVAAGPVVVARPGRPKIAVLGFHPALSAMRYQLSTPLLFANILRWMDPEVFRRWELSAASVGAVRLLLDPDVRASSVRVLHEDGTSVPFTLHGRTLDFFTGTPGAVRVLAGDREYVYSLTLPQLWDRRWQPPPEVPRGIPQRGPATDSWFELWYWLALAGGAGLVAEFILFGRFGRAGRLAAVLDMPRQARKIGIAK
jgi:hypothetical protein